MITTDLTNSNPDNLKGFASMIVASVLVPQDTGLWEEVSRGDERFCCPVNYVFGNLSALTEDHQNDKTSVLFKRLISADTITYTLQQYTTSWNDVATLNNNTLGLYYDFGSLVNTNVKGYVLSWVEVLNAYGVGSYRIKIARSILGVSDTLYTQVFALRNYSDDAADMTVRLDWIQNGNIIDDIDYYGCQWYQSIRLPGFFGNEQLKKEEVNLKGENYTHYQIRSDITKQWTIEIGWIPRCIANLSIYNFAQADQIWITDYNRDNYDYNLIRQAVVFESIDETKYNHYNRLAQYNMKFVDRTANHIKKIY